jgi:hypothetical protein
MKHEICPSIGSGMQPNSKEIVSQVFPRTNDIQLPPCGTEREKNPMPRKPQPRGTCAYCGAEFSKSGIGRHLKKCTERSNAIRAAEKSKRPTENLWHLRIQDAYDKDFWLDLEMSGSASLSALDRYLRVIWLECCGHLSEFTTGGFGGTTIGMMRKADNVFDVGGKLDHLYDFGTTSKTTIKVAGVRQGKALSGEHAISLMARNLQPEEKCSICNERANWLCLECLHERNRGGWFLCDEHAEEHPHQEYGEPMPLFNSPRVGMCGYSGPAEPPY